MEELISAYEREKRKYGCASFRYAVIRDGEKPRLLRGAVRFERTARQAEPARDYGRILLGEDVVEPGRAIEIVQSLLATSSVDGYDFHYPGKYELRLHEAHAKGLPVPSFDRFVATEWPSTVAQVYSGTYHVNDPDGPVVSVAHPLYTDAKRAISDWLGWGSSSLGNAVGVVLPDFRIRIERTSVFENHAKVAITAEGALLPNLVFKAGLGYGNDYVTPSIRMENEGFIVEFPRGIPSRFDVFILDRETGKVLDWQEFYTSWSELPKNVEFSVPEQQLAYFIELGESNTVEFKENLNDGSEFAETVVAFANTGDGVIFVGVDDNATIVGVTSPAKEKERILNFVESYCEPTPPVNVQVATIRGKDIVAVQVSKGRDPPYVHRSRGVVYVRRGGTDRPAKRADLDELYRR